jgi:hypothetical protein
MFDDLRAAEPTLRWSCGMLGVCEGRGEETRVLCVPVARCGARWCGRSRAQALCAPTEGSVPAEGSQRVCGGGAELHCHWQRVHQWHWRLAVFSASVCAIIARCVGGA